MSYTADLSPHETWELLASNPDAVLVDCRTEAEWNYVGVPELADLGKRTIFVQWVSFPDGVVNSDFIADLRAAGVTPEVPVAFICRSGQRSIAAAETAVAAGQAQAFNVSDGFEGGLDAAGHRGTRGWRAVGLPWRQG